ncbi:MFS quinate transporter QutD [Purpureocillium lilacinum]|uniref:MFS quinate transporter QutD n=1 Tax=Purpureocillium lilacinum TaxID=33203 RepID=A0A179GH86_PURLI|nr:MFS quinate transporter QutD [Purpureocillium lilacinum]OAQ76848.1 MFS quinate transporter QutD [Purpureocillium lilacinum]
MGLFHAVEDRPTPKEVYNWRLYNEAIIIATGSILFGYDSAFIGTTIARKSFVESFGVRKEQAADISSNITSAFQAGAFFGAILCFFVTEKVGRKRALQYSVVLFLIGAALMVAATTQLSYIYSGRALTGVACGAITATVPSYIAELSIVSIRGILTGLFEVAYQIGTLVGFWINYGINQHMNPNSSTSWRLPMAVQFIPAGILFVGGFFLHESPLWLMRNDREEEATRVLEHLRRLPRDHPYVGEDLDMMRVRLSEEADLARKYGQGSMAFAKGALFELSRRAINYYSPTLFASLGISDVSLYTGVYGLVKVGHPADVIKAGKPLSPSTAAGGQAATAMIMVYSTLLAQFAITKALPYLFNALGYGTWFFFASSMIVASIWAFIFLPETKGRTLNDMDIIL